MLLNESWHLGTLQLPHRLIQGPLAGVSCAPFRQLFSHFVAPAYCVSEMLSAHDVLYKHQANTRYLFRDANEGVLCYQIAGNDPKTMAAAASKLEQLGADLIDINAGCPKTKIRKKGAGSALLEQPEQFLRIVEAVRAAIRCPLTVKIRLQAMSDSLSLVQSLEAAGVDGLIVHGRRWTDDYEVPCNLEQIRQIKSITRLPVIANGDVSDHLTATASLTETGCDALMISRAGTGQPWLFQALLAGTNMEISPAKRLELLMVHLSGLAALESEHQAVLQSRSLIRYYFRQQLTSDTLQQCYALSRLQAIEQFLQQHVI